MRGVFEMSKDLVTNDELAFLAKRNKEMAVEEFLTDELKEKAKFLFTQALAKGVLESRLAQTLNIATANLVSMVTVSATEAVSGMDEEEVMTFFYRSVNQKGTHLMIVPVAELKAMTENPEIEALKEDFTDLPIRIYQQLSTLMGTGVEIELDSIEVGGLSTLETVKAFDLNQLTEVKQLQLVPTSETFTLNIMHLSDVSFVEGAYKGLVTEVKAEETVESYVPQSEPTERLMTTEAPTMSETVQPAEIYKPSFQTLTDVSSHEKVSDLNLLADVSLDIYAVLGKTKCSIQELLELNVGAVIELDKLVEEPIEIYANNKQIAEGELVVIEDNFGVKLTKLMK